MTKIRVPLSFRAAAEIERRRRLNAGGQAETEKRLLEFRGAAQELQSLDVPEWIISGPSETGKTFAVLWRIHQICMKQPAQGAIVRKQLADVYGTVLQTFQKKIISPSDGIAIYGGEKPEWFDYPSGARLWIGGMDKPGKVLSGERDFVFFNQAEEGKLEDWETITTRTTGRAGNIAHPFTCGDCNPSSSRHWIRERAKVGSLVLLQSYHKDNPALFDGSGVLTEQGHRTMETLERLTGSRRKRLLEGEWYSAEGLVYDGFNAEIHVQHRDPREFRAWMFGVDEGYTNPAVVLAIGIDGDLRVHIAEEFYERGKLQSEVVQAALDMARRHGQPHIVAVDASAAGLIADLRDNGLPAEAIRGRVQDGIALVQNSLKVCGDGRPRLTVEPTCVNVVNEFESYIWKSGKDEPVKENDHSLDALRYAILWLLAGEVEQSEIIYSPVKIGPDW
jgi:phage terminase large subunit